MAFSLLAAATCVGPKQSYSSIPWEMFACVLCNGGTGEFDLAEWAFQIIRAAVKKLLRDLAAGVRTLIVGGSHLGLLPWFFDWIDFGVYNLEQRTVPRISVYTGEICRRMIFLIREYPGIFPTKPQDEFDHLDEDWHDVVGGPGGFLRHAGQEDALRAAEALIAASRDNCSPPQGERGGQGRAGGSERNTVAYKGKGLADKNSSSSDSDSDVEPIDPSVRLVRTILRAERRGENMEAPPTSVRIPGVGPGARATGPHSLNRFRQRLLMRNNSNNEVGTSNTCVLAVNQDRRALLRSRGEHLRAELSVIEAQAKSDLKYARTHGVIKPREAMPGCAGVDCPHEGNEEERRDRVRSLAAVALAVVEQAIDNPDLFEGIFDQARSVLSGLGVEGYTGEQVPRVNGNSNNTPEHEENDGINWEDLERESQELVELGTYQPCTDAKMTIVAPALNGDSISSGGPNHVGLVGKAHQGGMGGSRGMPVHGELDDEFLAVAAQVPIDYTMDEEELNEENNLVGLGNLGAVHAALNKCIRWIAWIAATMVVGSARPGDDEDEDPPLNGQILLGWHGTEYREDACPSRQELVARVRHATRPHALDIQTSCRSAPPFHRDGRDGSDDQPPGSGVTLPEGGSASRFQQAIIKYLHDCANHDKTPSSVGARERATERGDAGELGPHAAPRPRALDVQTNCHPGPSFRRDDADGGDGKAPTKMLPSGACGSASRFQQAVQNYLRRCGIKYTVNNTDLYRCVQRMLCGKDDAIYDGWQDRFRGLFDPRFVNEICRDDGETDWDYIDTVMNSQMMGYRIDWLTKLWFPSKFMDCWAMYLMDKEKKTMMVLDPTETDVMDEMKIKHEARAKKFQRRFCSLFNNFFGNGLVDTDGWTFLYPLVAQHEPCSREDSGVYITHYYTDFTGLYLRSTLTQGQLDSLRMKLAYEIVNMKGNKGEIPDFLYDIIID